MQTIKPKFFYLVFSGAAGSVCTPASEWRFWPWKRIKNKTHTPLETKEDSVLKHALSTTDHNQSDNLTLIYIYFPDSSGSNMPVHKRIQSLHGYWCICKWSIMADACSVWTWNWKKKDHHNITWNIFDQSSHIDCFNNDLFSSLMCWGIVIDVLLP